MTCRRHARVFTPSSRSEEREVMRKVQYLVRINKDPGSDWGASVPDLPGCVATGKTVDAALRRIEHAISLHLDGLRADGRRPPEPRRRSVTPRQRSEEHTSELQSRLHLVCRLLLE